jgi:lipopolysaccharide/colanic/teichoic acid biosynthesis glycosyltransferase
MNLVSRGQDAFYARALKRPLDIVLAATLLVVLSPLLAVVAALVFLALGRPVRFIDRRAGRSGRPFGCLKFRSMTNDRDADGRLLPDEQRRTRLGNWLRATSLDELPQLWNILLGQMSFVGPRPLTVEYLDRYSPEQRQRHDLRPGLTGWAQVNGRQSISWERKFELDIWYVKNISFWLDAKIVGLTFWQHLRWSSAAATDPNSVGDFAGNGSSRWET